MTTPAIDALARALRIARHGLIRPLWEDMPDDCGIRVGWRNAAQRLDNGLRAQGFAVVQIIEEREDNE